MLYNFKDFHLSELFVATQDNFGNGGNEKKIGSAFSFVLYA